MSRNRMMIFALVAFALLLSADVGLNAERRASVKTVSHPLRRLDAYDAARQLTATLPGTDRKVIIFPNADSNAVIIQAPANRVRQYRRFLNKIDPPPAGTVDF